MQTLLNELEAQGLSDEQIQNLFLTIHEWLEAHYPVMAKIKVIKNSHKIKYQTSCTS
jgi:hypothetical protein